MPKKKIERISTSKLNREQWLELRTSIVGLGGSDIGTVVGLNPYNSSVNLFYQKIGYIPRADFQNESMFHGTHLEEYVANLWQHWDGDTETMIKNFDAGRIVRKCRKLNAIIVNHDYPYLFANIDRLIAATSGRGKGVLEVKTMSGYVADKWESGVPPSYIFQLQQYLLCTGHKWGEIVSLKDGREIDVIPFEANESIQNTIIEKGSDFINRVKEGKRLIGLIKNDQELIQALSEIEPDADDSQPYTDFLNLRHKLRESENMVDASYDHHIWGERYIKYSMLEKECKKRKVLNANKIKADMERQSASVVDFGCYGKITWRNKFNVKLQFD